MNETAKQLRHIADRCRDWNVELRQAADELDRLNEYRNHHEFVVQQIGEAIGKPVNVVGDVLVEIERLQAILSTCPTWLCLDCRNQWQIREAAEKERKE